MKRHLLHITTALMVLTIAAPSVTAQRIGFGISFGAGVTVENLGSTNGDFDLDFNESARPRAILANDTRSPVVDIRPGLNPGGVIRLRITAPADADVTVVVTVPTVLALDRKPNEGTIPVRIGWGYWNPGDAVNAQIPSELVTWAQEVVSTLVSGPTFSSVIFPMNRRAIGIAGPPTPPDPRFVGRTPTVAMAVAYLTVYGLLPEMPPGTKVGLYSGDIDIRVELSTYAAGGTP